VGLLIKTVSFVTTLAAGAPLLFLDQPLSEESMRICFASGFLLISTFYTWEIIFRIEMDAMLIVHHVTTLTLVVICAMGSFSLERDEISMGADEGMRQALESGRRLVLRITLVELLAAATNQPVMVALLLHRAQVSYSHRAFFVATLWEAVSKNMRFVLVLILYFNGAFVPPVSDHCDDIQWCLILQIMYPILATIIWFSNMHMVGLLWSLAKRRKVDTLPQSTPADCESASKEVSALK
jgi:hypothetical protein